MTTTRKHRRNRRTVGLPTVRSEIAPYEKLDACDVSNGQGSDPIDQTIGVWQKHTDRQLTREDGREIIENVTGFFRILQEWNQAERSAKSSTATKPTKPAGSVSGCEDRSDPGTSASLLAPIG